MWERKAIFAPCYGQFLPISYFLSSRRLDAPYLERGTSTSVTHNSNYLLCTELEQVPLNDRLCGNSFFLTNLFLDENYRKMASFVVNNEGCLQFFVVAELARFWWEPGGRVRISGADGWCHVVRKQGAGYSAKIHYSASLHRTTGNQHFAFSAELGK